MIIGKLTVARPVPESTCRITQEYKLTEVADYRIHVSGWMPNIKFEESMIDKYPIDESIFVNDSETKLNLEKNIECQNYLTTKYVGRAPLEYYGPPTEIGRQFLCQSKDGDPGYYSRVFGTQDALSGFNNKANELELRPLAKEDGHGYKPNLHS